MERKLNIILWTGFLLCFAVIVFFMWPGLSDKVLDQAAENEEEPLQIKRISGFEELAEEVIIKKDITYSKQYGTKKLDVYMPKQQLETPNPVIFWAHGGAYIAGDKQNVADYSIMLASKGYVVVNLNYSLAPEYQYPTPVLQVGDAYLYMATNAQRYGADMERVAFGGDSAGGQIIGQFVNMQVDHDYANQIGIEPIIKDPNTIKSVIFFSALLDINRYDENESAKANKLFDQSAQAYFALEDWKESDIVNDANIVGNASEEFPPTYLTDGNTASFQTQAEELAEQLGYEQVPVQTTFFSRDQTELRHQYQFRLGLKEAVENYETLTNFLVKYLKEE